MELPDTLSRAQLTESTPEMEGLEWVSVLSFISVSDQKYAQLQESTKEELKRRAQLSPTDNSVWLARPHSCSAILGLKQSACFV